MNELTSDMLSMLAYLYKETAVGYRKISMTKAVNAYLPQYSYKNALKRAIFLMGIFVPEPNAAGRPPLHWNLEKWGAPSLRLADLILDRSESIRKEWAQEYTMKIKMASLVKYNVVVKQSTRKQPCQRCPFKGSMACETFAAQGFDCKSFNMETFKITKDEAGMG